jgi:ATP-dependent DNA helicase RecG
MEENAKDFDNFRTELPTRFAPAVTQLHWIRVPCTLHNGQPEYVVLLWVEKSDQVHSIVANGTWTRMDSNNRELSAAEIANLACQRGIKSAETEPVAVSLDLLDTLVWRSFVGSRGLRTGNQAEQLLRIGLADKVKQPDGTEEVLPKRAAVLLFAEEPGSLLAGHSTRADVRLMVYEGKAAQPGSTPNLRKKPKTIRGPLIEQINESLRQVLDALTEGITLVGRVAVFGLSMCTLSGWLKRLSSMRLFTATTG